MKNIIKLINTILNCNDYEKIFVVLFIVLFFVLVYKLKYLFESDLNMILLQNKEVEMNYLITYIFFYLVYVISNYCLIGNDIYIETVFIFIIFSVYNMGKYIILKKMLKKKESCKNLLFKEEIMFVIVMPIILLGFVDNNNDYLLIVLIGAAVQSFISIMIIKTQKKQTIFIYNNKLEKLYFYYKKNEYIVCGTNKNIKDVDNIKIIYIYDFIQGKYFLSYKDIEDTTPNIENKTKGNEKIDEISPLKYKWYENILFVINFLFMPWKISKKFKIKNKIYDDLIIISIYFMMSAIGIFLYIIGIFGVYKIIKLICTFKFSRIAIDKIVYAFVIALYGLFFGSINVVSAKQLLNEKDTDKIYSFGAIMVSVYSCIISFIVLVKDINFK